MSGVIFPLKGKILNLEAKGPMTIPKSISKNEYWIRDFMYDEADKDQNDYKQTVKVKANKAYIQIIGNENGLAIIYTFRKIKGKWMLVSFEDFST